MTPDREKVIKGLECCMKWTGEPNTATCHCSDCSYTNMDILGQRCLIDLINDALALLKEQDAVEPIKPLDKDDGYTFMCSNCKGELFCGDVIRDNFCPTCGRSVKWE